MIPDLETLSKEYKINIVEFNGVPEHGKIEIDTVGTQIAIRRSVSNCIVFDTTSQPPPPKRVTTSQPWKLFNSPIHYNCVNMIPHLSIFILGSYPP